MKECQVLLSMKSNYGNMVYNDGVSRVLEIMKYLFLAVSKSVLGILKSLKYCKISIF